MIETGLKGKVAIVTGASAGIGYTTAKTFAEEGCRVALWDVDEEKGKLFEKELSDTGLTSFFQKVNVADSKEVDDAVCSVIEKWGQVDVLVSNAGIVRDGQLIKWKNGDVVSQMKDDQWDAVIGVNLKGVFNCTRAVAPQMIKQGNGVILSASSVVALYGNFGQTNYVATKTGVIGLTKTWARELGKYGIRVNAVAPGFVATEILASMPQQVLDGMVAKTPVKRIGRTEDIANAYLWLASDAASFITGHVLSVDGGLVIGT